MTEQIKESTQEKTNREREDRFHKFSKKTRKNSQVLRNNWKLRPQNVKTQKDLR